MFTIIFDSMMHCGRSNNLPSNQLRILSHLRNIIADDSIMRYHFSEAQNACEFIECEDESTPTDSFVKLSDDMRDRT